LNNSDDSKRVERLYSTLLDFKNTEQEIKMLELIDMNECKTLKDTIIKTTKEKGEDIQGKVMLDDGFAVMIKNYLDNTDY